MDTTPPNLFGVGSESELFGTFICSVYYIMFDFGNQTAFNFWNFIVHSFDHICSVLTRAWFSRSTKFSVSNAFTYFSILKIAFGILKSVA